MRRVPSEPTIDEPPRGDAFEAAMATVDEAARAELRDLVRDASYVVPRVVTHTED